MGYCSNKEMLTLRDELSAYFNSSVKWCHEEDIELLFFVEFITDQGLIWVKGRATYNVIDCTVVIEQTDCEQRVVMYPWAKSEDERLKLQNRAVTYKEITEMIVRLRRLGLTR